MVVTPSYHLGFGIMKVLLLARFQQRKVIECWERNLFHSQTLGACCSVSTPTGILALRCGSRRRKTLQDSNYELARHATWYQYPTFKILAKTREAPRCKRMALAMMFQRRDESLLIEWGSIPPKLTINLFT